VVPIVSIVGKSDSGKTTLIEKLIPILKRRGYRIATIKHDVHGFEMDREGKDTYRHFHSGAEAVLISSPKKMALIQRVEQALTLDELVGRFYPDMDLIMTEGFKQLDKPKIEVFRSAAHTEPLCTAADNRVALVSDTPIEIDCPRFDINDVETIADFIEERFLKSAQCGS
jgi:molybdopterin-guanine dinucleotide biosynthesis protein B